MMWRGDADGRPALHHFFRSSTSHRVRIALNLKGIGYDPVAVNLRAAEHQDAAYRALNPHALVPTLEFPDGTAMTQSLAIIEYLDETVPDPPLLPPDPLGRSRVRSLAQAVALDIHPLNNLRVLNALRTRFAATEDQVADWFRHWVAESFAPLEQRLANENPTSRYCHGNAPGLADICLVAQVVSNARFDIDHSPYPTISRIAASCNELEVFRAALPDHQADAV